MNGPRKGALLGLYWDLAAAAIHTPNSPEAVYWGCAGAGIYRAVNLRPAQGCFGWIFTVRERLHHEDIKLGKYAHGEAVMCPQKHITSGFTLKKHGDAILRAR